MAARKSCTHLTWAEAKAKVGGVSAKGGASTKSKDKVKGGNTHDKMLAAKIISKKMNVSEGEQIANRQAAKLAKKDLERAAYLEQKRQEEKLLKLQNQNISIYELTKSQLKSTMKKLILVARDGDENGNATSAVGGDRDEDSISVILECKQLQLDEILALESIYNVVIDDEEVEDGGGEGGNDDNDDGEEEDTIQNKKVVVCDNCQIDKLRDLIAEEPEGFQTQIVNHPPISFVAQLIITNEEFGVGEDNHAMCLLVKVTFPNYYPLGQQPEQQTQQHQENLPILSIEYCMIVDVTQIVNCNKVLESLGYISSTDMENLQNDMIEYITSTLLPDPCIYDILSNWLPTNIYNYVTMNQI